MDYLAQFEDEDDEIIAENPEYTPKSDFSKAEITKECVQKCITNRAVEMKAGHWNIKVMPNGIQREYKTDTRKAYTSCVEALRNLLYPELISNPEFLEREKKIRIRIEELFKKYCYKERELQIIQTPTGQRPIWKTTGREFLPDIDATVTISDPSKANSAKTGRGLWNNYVNLYWDEIVLEYDKIFALLNNLIANLNYFRMHMRFAT